MTEETEKVGSGEGTGVSSEARQDECFIILVTDKSALQLFRLLFQAFQTPDCCWCYLEKAGLDQHILDREFDIVISAVKGGNPSS